MATKINGPMMLPRLPGHPGAGFDRAKFLDGTYKTYFGPGQIGAIYEQAIGVTDPSFVPSYRPPTAWMSVGMLLRKPQVVWINDETEFGEPADYPGPPTYANFAQVKYAGSSFPSSGPGSAFGITTDPWWVTVDPLPTVGSEYDTEVGGIGQDSLSTLRCEVVAVQAVAFAPFGYEAAPTRLRDEIAAAKATIESLRPGRTWIETNEFGGDPMSRLPRPLDADGFFGLDLLAIDCARFYSSSAGGAGTLWPDYATTIANMGRTRGLLYHSDEEPEIHDDPGGGNIGPQLNVNPGTYIPDGQTLYVLGTASPIYITQPHLTQAQVDEEFATDMAACSDSMDADAEALADQGVEHAGGTSELTADSIVKLIADFYGFDPGTGIDNPLT